MDFQPSLRGHCLQCFPCNRNQLKGVIGNPAKFILSHVAIVIHELVPLLLLIETVYSRRMIRASIQCGNSNSH